MSKPVLKVAVMGAGAVGCYYGALLARAGADVTLIGRAGLAARQSVSLHQGNDVHDIAVTTTQNPAGVSGADVVLFCVKSGDTADAARLIAPYLAPHAVVLSLQNGITNGDALAKVVPNPVISGLVYVAVSMPDPGVVIHRGGGRMVLPNTPQAQPVAAQFASYGLVIETSSQAEQAAWTKFVVNCCVNAISALGRSDYQTMGADHAVMDLMRGVFDECSAVARASDVDLPSDLWPQVLQVMANMPLQTSSTAQDLARGKPSEIDYLNGEIARRAADLGISAPRNHALWALVKLAEQKHD